MQLRILLIKDLKALFKQKAVIFTLMIPSFLIMGLGVLPIILGVDEPFSVGFLNEDDQSNSTLGSQVIQELKHNFDGIEDIKLEELKDYQEFVDSENAFWFPSNFTDVANITGISHYFIKYSDSDLRAESIMRGVIVSEIDAILTRILLGRDLPEIQGERVFTDQRQVDGNGVAQNRGDLAFPLAYMAFLILILSSSSMRITGFSAEKEAGMMELLLSSVINRRELVLSKLLTGMTYGIASTASYGLGLLFLFLVQDSSSTSEISFIILNPALLTPKSVVIIFLMFIVLSFISIEILLSAQLAFGREAGDRLGSMGLMILSFLFYFSALSDPLSLTGLQLVNPFFWPFRIALNLIFGIEFLQTILLLVINTIFCLYLLGVMTRSIEKETALFE